ncbi:efflux RND transporter permease subunit [Campylobacter mucosalis]|uniref:RND superfamily exporter n=1 Tax=Campylobacter mucosalis CCUG 21559 TaxID=1032067 RepID=A0A6G5QEM7_9BACT|nr:MMPL family transporter [Campylobacter mucosalis]QCD44074.1 RND superfamily exporter [Campylobacter mucosalis CCUG 21559]
MKRAFKILLGFSKPILAVVFTLTIVLGYFSTKLEVDASSETLLLENDKDLAIWRDVIDRYASSNFLVVTYTPKDDLFSKNSLELIENLSNELAKNELVQNVINITNVPLLKSIKGGLTGILDHTPTLKDTDINVSLAKLEFATSPIYSSNLISKDLKTTAIVLNLKEDKKYIELLNHRNSLLKQNSDQKQLEKAKDELKAYRDELRIKEHNGLENIKQTIQKFKNEQNELFLGGAQMIADDMISFVKSDLYTYGISAALLLAFSLWLFFRQIIWIVLPIFICVVSVIFSSGLFGLFGWEITVISSNYIALVLIITISVVIHLTVTYREFHTKHPKFSQKALIYLTLRDKASPSFWAIFTTIVGFASLATADIKPVIMLGVMMSAGIFISLILAFVLFGAILVNFNKIAPVRTFESSFSFTKKCADFAILKPKFVYTACVVCVVFGAYGISQLKVENSFIGYFKKNTQIRQGMQVIDENLGGTVPVDVIIKFKDNKEQPQKSTDEFENEFEQISNDEKYWFNSYRTRVAEKTHEYLKNKNFVGSVGSLATLTAIIRELNDGKVDDFLLSAMYEKLPKQYKDILLSPYVNIKADELRFALRIKDSDENLRRDRFLKEIKSELNEILKDDNVEVSVVGMMVLYNNMLLNLVSSQFDSFGVSVAILFVLFCLIFKSVKLALIAIITNLIPLCVLFGTMGIFGIPLDVMSITIAAISIGIGVDDIIHYLHRFRHELSSKSIKEAIKASHASIGYAMYYTSFAIFLGFSVMMSSNFIPTIYFGLLTDMVMALMLLSALVILPRLLIGFYKK